MINAMFSSKINRKSMMSGDGVPASPPILQSIILLYYIFIRLLVVCYYLGPYFQL